MKDKRNTPLHAEIKNGQLIISIGVETLVWASQPENGGPLGNLRIAEGKADEWAKDVLREVLFEDGDYNAQSYVSTFLDEMMTHASNHGSSAIEE